MWSVILLRLYNPGWSLSRVIEWGGRVGNDSLPFSLRYLTKAFFNSIFVFMETELAIPSGLFCNSRAPLRNDRYAVYRMLNRKVIFRTSSKSEEVSGYVDDVYRDIFSGELRLTIKGQVFRFKEPDVIRENAKEFVFIYGDVGRGKQDITDDRLFDEIRQGQYRESVSDTMSRIAPKRLMVIRFRMGERKPSRRKPFLMRGISPEVTMSIGSK
jgi:hypothetical protein